MLTRDYITPNELFYVRNHLPVPEIDPSEYKLIVKGKGLKKKFKFTLEDLKTKFKKHEVITTLQCAGNRREDLHRENMREFLAPHWVVGAISTAKWGGVKIRDVLKECGLDVDALALGELEIPGLEHVQFESYDQDETGEHGSDGITQLYTERPLCSIFSTTAVNHDQVFTMEGPSHPPKLWMVLVTRYLHTK